MPGYGSQSIWPPQQTPPPPSRKSRGVPILLGALVVLVLAVGGLAFALLGGSKPAGRVAAGSTTPSSAPSPVAYSSANDLRAALLARGVPCRNSELIPHDQGAPPGVTGESVSCTSYRDEIDLDVYDTQANTEGRIEYQQALTSGLDGGASWFVIGDRWTVQATNHDDALQVAATMGGEVKQVGTGTTATTGAVTTATSLTAADIRLTVHITKKDCFGSAGCNVEYQIKAAIGVPAQECKVTYDVHGLEDTQTGTLDFHADGTYEQDSYQAGQTTSSSKKLTAKVTDVEC